MSTRAQIAIQIGPEEWAHVYSHFDGYPEHMLPALAAWTPEDILAAREIRQVTPEKLDCFDPPRAPRSPPRLANLGHASTSRRRPTAPRRSKDDGTDDRAACTGR